MSLTNRVIIPKVGSRQNLEEQKVFKHSSFTLTPQKDQRKPESIYWKKSMSAFKKYKQKRDKKDKRDPLGIEEPDNQDPHSPKRYIKLVKKNYRSISTVPIAYESLINSLMEDPTLCYFDPNEAPLYLASGEEAAVILAAQERKVVTKPQPTVTHISQVKLQSMESQVMQEQIPMLVALQPQPGDPFIIIRKNSSRKSSKSAKTKFIKKQKIQKNRFKDPFSESDLLFKDRSKYSVSGDVKLEEKESEKDSSSEKVGRGGKQIYTLHQLVKEANQKKLEQNRKMGKIKNSGSDPGYGDPVSPDKKECD